MFQGKVNTVMKLLLAFLVVSIAAWFIVAPAHTDDGHGDVTIYRYAVSGASLAYETVYPGYTHVVDNAITSALSSWEKVNPGIGFVRVDHPADADFMIEVDDSGKWRVSEYEHIAGFAQRVGCLPDGTKPCKMWVYVEGVGDGSYVRLAGHQILSDTVAHELGHLLGFPHHTERTHIMNVYGLPGDDYHDTQYGYVTPPRPSVDYWSIQEESFYAVNPPNTIFTLTDNDTCDEPINGDVLSTYRDIYRQYLETEPNAETVTQEQLDALTFLVDRLFFWLVDG